MLNKDFGEGVRSVSFQLCLPEKTLVAVKRLMSVMNNVFLNKASKVIQENLLKECEVRRSPESKVGLLCDCLDNQEFRNFLSWYGGTKTWLYDELCTELLGHTLTGGHEKNTHIVNRMVENLGGNYVSAMRAIKSNKERRFPSCVSKEDVDIIELMDKLKAGESIESAIVKKCNSKTKKIADKGAKMLVRFNEHQRQLEIGECGWTYDTLFIDHVVEECAKARAWKDDGFSFADYIGDKKMTRLHKEMEKLWDSERVARKIDEMICYSTVTAYLHQPYKKKFVQYLESDIKKHPEKERVNRKKINYYINNKEKVEREYYSLMTERVNEFVERGGVKVTKDTIDITRSKDEPTPIRKVEDIPQFKELGITMIGNCKWALRVKLFTDKGGVTFAKDAFDNIQHEYKRFVTYSMIDRTNPGYVYLPIYISDHDDRDWNNFDMNRIDGDMITICEEKTRKGTKLFAHLSYKVQEIKPWNRFLEGKNAGIDVNVKHNLISTSASEIMADDDYVDIPKYVYDYYTSLGDYNRIQSLDDWMNLGQINTMVGHHCTFGMMDELDMAFKNGRWISGFVKSENGKYYPLQDPFIDALNKMRVEYASNSKKLTYIANVIKLRSNIRRLHCLELEYKDRQSDSMLNKLEFAKTDEGIALVEKKNDIKNKIEEEEVQIIAYASYLHAKVGIRCINLEYIETGTWRRSKGCAILHPKKFYKGCLEMAKASGLELTQTDYYKNNHRFFTFDLNNFVEDKIKLNEDGEYENKKRFFHNSKCRYVSLASLKLKFLQVSKNYDLQITFGDARFTSQCDPMSGEVNKEFRKVQEMFVCKNGNIMNSDYVSALNNMDIIENPIKREGLLEENTDKKGVQLVPKKQTNDKVLEVYEHARMNKNSDNNMCDLVETGIFQMLDSNYQYGY